MSYEPHQQSVIDEHMALMQRINSLYDFIQRKAFLDLDEAEQVRLRAQIEFMDGYAFMLQLRIEAFKKTNGE
jgi:hypothetical protein